MLKILMEKWFRHEMVFEFPDSVSGPHNNYFHFEPRKYYFRQKVSPAFWTEYYTYFYLNPLLGNLNNFGRQLKSKILEVLELEK